MAGRNRAAELLYDQPHWYACHTRSRHEKTVDTQLKRQRIESYLPTVAQKSQWRDRQKLVRLPLFPGYVFGRFTLDRLVEVLSIPGVATIVGTRGSASPIPDAEIESVRLLSQTVDAAGVGIDRVALLDKGDRVRVNTGPLQGVEGIVVERHGRRRVLVAVPTIGQGVEVDVGIAALVPIRGTHPATAEA